MNTLTVDGLVLEAESVNEQIKNGEKTTHDFAGETVAILHDGQLKRIMPYIINDKNTNKDGTWRVTVDDDGDFYANDSWYIMKSDGNTQRNAKFFDGDWSKSSDTVHRVVGYVNESTNGSQAETVKAEKMIVFGDERFLMIDGKIYPINE